MAVAPDDILTSRKAKNLELIRPKQAVSLTKKKILMGYIEGQNYISGLTESSVASNVGLEGREMAVAPDDILTSRNTKNLELIRPKQAVSLTKKKKKNTKGYIEGQNYISGLTESSVTSNVGLEGREMAVAPDDILTSRNTKKNLELIRPKLAVSLTKKKSTTKKIAVPRKRKSSLPKKKVVGSIKMDDASPRNNSERLTSSMVDDYGSLTKRGMDVTMDDGNSTVETPIPPPQPQVNNKKRSKEQNIIIP
ncbi:unnamed protein product [Meganyctiphanes norvegica]|uniref:Uncharacterized protein n=1 Tax=Meganyctiphanes norvegica TaxID=48144 RepID=A0AAV2SLC3_MEGNR